MQNGECPTPPERVHGFSLLEDRLQFDHGRVWLDFAVGGAQARGIRGYTLAVLCVQGILEQFQEEFLAVLAVAVGHHAPVVSQSWVFI